MRMRLIFFVLLLCCGTAARAADMVLEARQAKVESPVADSRKRELIRHIGMWNSTNMTARWTFDVPAKASYHVFATLACAAANSGSTLEISVGSQRATCVVPDTGSWTTFKELDLGPILLRKTGPAELIARVTQKGAKDSLDLQRIRLVPDE